MWLKDKGSAFFSIHVFLETCYTERVTSSEEPLSFLTQEPSKSNSAKGIVTKVEGQVGRPGQKTMAQMVPHTVS